MSDSLWMDITTEDADALADFYVNVMGWKKRSLRYGRLQRLCDDERRW